MWKNPKLFPVKSPFSKAKLYFSSHLWTLKLVDLKISCPSHRLSTMFLLFGHKLEVTPRRNMFRSTQISYQVAWIYPINYPISKFSHMGSRIGVPLNHPLGIFHCKPSICGWVPAFMETSHLYVMHHGQGRALWGADAVLTSVEIRGFPTNVSWDGRSKIWISRKHSFQQNSWLRLVKQY